MNFRILKAVIIYIFVNTTVCLHAQTIHVDKHSESEHRDGSTEHPFKTIREAVNFASEGDKILVHEGTYREKVEFSANGITFEPYEDDNVVISGSEPVFNWQEVGNEVYKATVPWDVTENNQDNQVFVDGKMLHVARWPDETSDDFVANPVVAKADKVEDIGTTGVYLIESDFDEPAARWTDSKVWLNIARNGHDGSGWTGDVTFISQSQNKIKVVDESGWTDLKVNNGNFGLGPGTEFYLCNPSADGVYETGGPQQILSRGEWWKNGDTLFVRLPDGEAPAETIDETNLIEVKKRVWAFAPAETGQNYHGITIKGFEIFAASICTELGFENRESAAEDCYNFLIDSIKFKYIYHATNKNENLSANIFAQRSGLVLSGVGHTVSNCEFDYSAASAISPIGDNMKIIGNSFYHINYLVSEAGVINSGRKCRLRDPEISYNYFYNTPHMAISINSIYNTEPEKHPGKARIHHNIVDGFMLRSHDGGALNASAGRDWTNIRVDHNIILNGTNKLANGIYFDFGGNTIIDHNIISNVDGPIVLNRYHEVIGKHLVYNNLALNSNLSRPGFGSAFRNDNGDQIYLKNNIVSAGWGGKLNLAEIDSCEFVSEKKELYDLYMDPDNHDFRLKESAKILIDKGVSHDYNDSVVIGTPDIGSYEFGSDPWIAGPANTITRIEISPESAEIEVGDTLIFDVDVYENIFNKLETMPDLDWEVSAGGEFFEAGKFVASEPVEEAIIKVSNDNKIIRYATVKINENKTDTASSVFETSEKSIPRLKVFPNPAIEFISIDNKDTELIQIVNVHGEVVSEFNIRMIMPGERIDVSGLRNGLYLVKTMSRKHQRIAKFLKIK